jgi:hypothetical protein
VLAQLNGIDGVESVSASVGNPEGALVRVTERPGADSAQIAEKVRRALREAITDRPPVQVSSRAAAAALREKEWLDPRQLGELAATDPGASEGRAPGLLVVLLLAALAVILGLLGWRHFRREKAGPSPLGPRLSPPP